MAILTITLLLANVALVAAAIVKIKNLEGNIAHDMDMLECKIENVRMRHKLDIKEFEECMVTKLDNVADINQTLSDLVAAVGCVTDEVNTGIIDCKAEVKDQVVKSTENLFWRIVTTPMKIDDK